MKRREFIQWAGLSAIASYLPVALVACSSEASNSKEKAISVGTVAELESAGYLLDEESKVMVVKNAEGELSAVNPTCTHRGCVVEWKADANALVCPCHNAKFAPDGKVLAKPATTDLPTYEVTTENDEILVIAS